MRSFVFSLSLLPFILTACGGGDDEPAPFIPDIVVETGDTAVEPPALKLVDEVRFTASIAWDPALGEVVTPYTIDGETGFISALRISLYEIGAYEAGDPDGVCKVVIDLVGTPMTQATLEDPLAWGIDIVDGETKAYETCMDQGFDVSSFIDDPVTDWASTTYSIMAGGAPTPALETWLVDVFGVPEYELINFAAADFATDPETFSTEPDNNFIYGHPMDDSYNVDLSSQMSRDAFMTVDGLALGYYRFDQRVVWRGLSE
jgi:hypothetical protein